MRVSEHDPIRFCRAFGSGDVAAAFLREEIVAVDYTLAEDLSWVTGTNQDRELLKAKIKANRATDPKWKPENQNLAAGILVGSLLQFLCEWKKGEVVMVPAPSTLYVGRLASSYIYDPSGESHNEAVVPTRPGPHTRRVQWVGHLAYEQVPDVARAAITSWSGAFSLRPGDRKGAHKALVHALRALVPERTKIQKVANRQRETVGMNALNLVEQLQRDLDQLRRHIEELTAG
jgi:predicted Mrr-cat superfamily restriction endonuclease